MRILAKFLFPVAAIFAVVFLSIAAVRIMRDRDVLLDDLERRARVISKSLTPAAVRSLKQPPASDEESLAERLSGQGRTMGLLLCDARGNVIARSAALSEITSCDDANVRAALENNAEQTTFGTSRGHTLHALTSPLTSKSGEVLGTITIVHEASYIDARIRSAIMWTTLTLATLAMFISIITYVFSRRSFERSVDQVLDWMKSSRKQGGAHALPPPTASLLKPVAWEVEKLTTKLRSAKETAREVSQAAQAHDLWTPARLKAHAVSHLGESPLIVVSNREPYMHVKEQGRMRVVMPPSGLVTSLDPVLRAASGLWIAHGSGSGDRETVDSESKVLVPPDAPLYTLKRMWLTREEEDGYYYGFSNEALWPLCHLTNYRPEFEEADWATYQQVNQKFADAVVAECAHEKPVILVQDYHFTLLPAMIRERCPNAIIILFWHIPWPTSDMFQVCPWKREILEGMLGANVIGFHLQSYCNHFFDTVNALLPVRIEPDRGAVLHGDQTTLVKPFPISIQPWEERGMPDDAESRAAEEKLRQELDLGDARLVVSVDRVDYTKGIPERLGAIDRFFEKYPEYRERVTFVQLAAPSRIHMPRYRDFMTDVEKRVDRVNWNHSTQSWKPVVFLRENHDAKAVYHFMRMSDACIVSSLADGMNLVAKEYVAARSRDDGVLILSEFTGVAREFEDALQVNPYARADFAETIRVALEMPLDEQRARMTRLRAQVAEHNVYEWASALIGSVKV